MSLLTTAEEQDLWNELPKWTVTVSRGDATVYTDRAVHMRFPTATEVLGVGGARIRGFLYDVPGSTYELNDVVEITAVPGQGTLLPAPVAYYVGEVTPLGDHWPSVRAELTGTNR